MKSQADELFEILKDKPEVAIRWAENEIRQFQKLIKLIKKSLKLPRKPIVPVDKILV